MLSASSSEQALSCSAESSSKAEMFSEEDEWAQKADIRPEKETFLGDLTAAFTDSELTGEAREEANRTIGFVPCSHPKNTKLYRILLACEKITGNEYFTVSGEEMAECWCNGSFAGVSFWNSHRFAVGRLLKPGRNEILLRFTGNAANIYAPALTGGKAPQLPFGLMR